MMGKGDMQEVKKQLLNNPELHNTPIPGFNQLRKLRWSIKGNTASLNGDARIINAYIESMNIIALLWCYPKSAMEDLSRTQYKMLIGYTKMLEIQGRKAKEDGSKNN